MSLSVGETFAGYTIVRLIGSGGMGEVYLARHPRLPREDALKVLRPDVSSDEEFRQRFIREADLASALKHPNIVTVHDRGEFDGQLWIATEYVEGTDAAQLMAARYPVGMPVEEVAAIITAIADALDYAHGRGLLHRDVKPGNILLGQPDHAGQRRVFLADFGIARPMADPNGLTATNLTLGTVAYAAPEQLMGEPLDGRADEYALAATTFHLLTGGPPYEESNPVAVISKHLNEVPPKLSGQRPELAALDDVLSRALAKDPADRFGRCAQFATALSGQVTGVSINNHATQAADRGLPTSGRQKTRGEKRPRILIGTAIAVAAAIVLGLIGYANISQHKGVPGPVLDGTYRIDYNLGEQTVMGSPNGPPETEPQVRTVWIAFRSTCGPNGCVATGTRLDDNNHQIASTPVTVTQYHFVDKSWQSVQKTREQRDPCSAEGNKSKVSSHTVLVARTLEPQPNGTLRGMLTNTVVSSECDLAGAVYQVPSLATRIGGVPHGIVDAVPGAMAPAPSNTSTPTTAGPKLDGTYSLRNLFNDTTVNGRRIVSPTSSPGSDDTTDWWAFRSLCTAVGCVATGASLDRTNHQEAAGSARVLRFDGGQWNSPPFAYVTQCGDIPGGLAPTNPTNAVAVSWEFVMEPQPDGTLRGTRTTRVLGDGCNSEGMVITFPIVLTRTGDAPTSVIVADPSLFLP